MTPPTEKARAAVDALANRTLSPEEIRAYLDTPVSDQERDEILALVQWFRGRYPTGADRLGYVRRAYARWTRR